DGSSIAVPSHNGSTAHAAASLHAKSRKNQHGRELSKDKPLKTLEDIGYLSQGSPQLHRVGISRYSKFGRHNSQRSPANNPGFVSQRGRSFDRLGYIVIATRSRSKDPVSLCVAYL